MNYGNERLNYCGVCGAHRGVNELRHRFNVETSFAASACRRLSTNRAEPNPRLVAAFAVWRDGAGLTSEHICADCVRVGLVRIRHELDALLLDSANQGRDQGTVAGHDAAAGIDAG